MKKIRIALLISGGGTTAEAVIRACQSGELKDIKPVVVISSRADSLGIVRANHLGIPTRVVSPKESVTPTAFGKKILKVLASFRVDVVSQNGWLPMTPVEVIHAYKGKIINQHPGPLDPGRVDFGGKGMFGKRVTCARVAYAWMKGANFWTEATTHHVTAEFDKGTVVRRVKMRLPRVTKPIPFRVLRDNTKKLIHGTNAIADQLLPLEHTNVIETLQMFASGKALPEVRRSRALVSKKDRALVDHAKELAIELFPKG